VWDPFGPLGVAGSPQREVAYLIGAWVLFWPWTILFVQAWYRGDPELAAPLGRYVPGTIYPLFSVYNIAGIAIASGFTVATAGISYGGLDLTYFSDPFCINFFGTWIISMFAWINFIVRGTLFYGVAPVRMVASFAFETFIYSFMSFGGNQLWMFPMRKKRQGMVPSWAHIVNSAIYCFCYMMPAVVVRGAFRNPGAAYLPWLIAWLPTNLVTGMFMYTIGSLGAEYAIRAVYKVKV